MTNLSKAVDNTNMFQSSRPMHAPHATLISYKASKFLITDQPTQQNMDLFIKECQSYHASDLVRVCEPDYNKVDLEKAGIRVHDWLFDDGSPPPQKVIDDWHELVKQTCLQHPEKESCIAVHCKAGLGRAPALVAISLIEMGLTYDKAIELIREKRKGALNARQIQFLKSYRPKRRFKSQASCNIM